VSSGQEECENCSTVNPLRQQWCSERGGRIPRVTDVHIMRCTKQWHTHKPCCEHQGSEIVCREGLQQLHESRFSRKIRSITFHKYANWPYRERPPGQKVQTQTNKHQKRREEIFK